MLAIDETVFAWLGTSCPVRVYIPRKPNPNGLLSYGLCTWVTVGTRKLPLLLDTVPYCQVDSKMTAQESMMELMKRFRQVLPPYHHFTVITCLRHRSTRQQRHTWSLTLRLARFHEQRSSATWV